MRLRKKAAAAVTAVLTAAGLLAALPAAPAQAASGTASIVIETPTIVETGVQNIPEGVSDAAASAKITINFTTVRSWWLQRRPHAGGAWVNIETHPVGDSHTGSNTFKFNLFQTWDYRVAINEPSPAANTFSNIVTYTHAAPVFSDDFSGSALDLTKWEMLGGNGYVDGVLGLAKRDWSASSEGGGLYTQRIIQDPAYGTDCTDADTAADPCHLLHSHVNAKNFRIPLPTFGHSVWISSRVKFDMNYKGSTGAFWTYDSTPANDADYNEHDIAEYFGNSSGGGSIVRTTYKTADATRYDQTRQPPAAGTQWSDSYHIFTTRYSRDSQGALFTQEYVDGFTPIGGSTMAFPTTASTYGRTCPATVYGCEYSVPQSATDQLLMISNHIGNWQQDPQYFSDEDYASGRTHDVNWDWVQVWTD